MIYILKFDLRAKNIQNTIQIAAKDWEDSQNFNCCMQDHPYQT